jgi:phosphatidylinositol alpha-1,6-mannosyltransferase
MKKFRILVTAYDFRPMLGGIATCASEICESLSQFPDIEIRVIAKSMPGSKEFDQKQNYEVRRIALHHRPEFSIFKLTSAIQTEVRDFAPDAILNFLWLPEAVSSCFTKTRVPYFTIVHGVEVLESKFNFRKRIRGFASPLKRFVFKRAQKILTVSHYTKTLVEKTCAVDPQKIAVIYNAVSAEKFTPGPKPEYLLDRYHLREKKILYTITRLVDYKGIDFMLRSLPELIRHQPELHYLIAGVGEDESRLRGIVQELGLQKQVTFIGKITDSELADHYRLCDCFVMLSREDYVTPNVEGFGLVYLEAAACAKPAIAGRGGGVPDAVEDGVSGLLVDPCNNSEIVASVARIFSEPNLLKNLGEAAHLRVLKNFSWQKMAERIVKEMKTHVRN